MKTLAKIIVPLALFCAPMAALASPTQSQDLGTVTSGDITRAETYNRSTSASGASAFGNLNFEASVIQPGLTGANSSTNNPTMIDMRTGGAAQITNAELLLMQEWTPDYTDMITGDSGKTQISCVYSSEMEKYEGNPKRDGLNKFVLADNNMVIDGALGSITIMAKLGKGDKVDMSVLKADLAKYVNDKWSRQYIVTKRAWMSSNFGVRSKGQGVGASGTAGLGGGIFGNVPGDVATAFAGAFTGNTGSMEVTPVLSMTVLLKPQAK